MLGHKRRLALVRLAVSATVLIMAAIGFSSRSAASQESTTGTETAGGTVTYGLPPATTINYIWPFMSIQNASNYNGNQFQYLLYRPLYIFGNNSNTSVSVDYTRGTADPPVYSNGGKTVTINLKGWKWSNRETVDAKDVIFWLNMMEAEKANWYGYAPGLIPDNLVSYKATGPDQVTITMNRTYSSLWFTYNQLAQITPMPMAWDVTSTKGAPGSGGCTTDTAADKWAKCIAVYNFLAAQANNSAGYVSSPLWSVVDGPFKLSYFNINGNVTIVPNRKYSGSPKPVISAFKYVPFASDSATYAALKAGKVDIAQVPWSDLPPKPPAAPLPPVNPLGSRYYLTAFDSFGINYIQLNFNGPTRMLVRQLYIRQALQELADQPTMDTFWGGYAYPTSGPVPSEPPSQWKPPSEDANGGQGTYPFSVSAARKLLTSHGWSEVGKTMTCVHPALCGTGISRGTQLKFTMYYAIGFSQFVRETDAYTADAARIGVRIHFIGQSFNTVLSEATPCTPGPKCSWSALTYGGWVFDGPGYEPTGEPLFETGAGANSGSYSNRTEDSLISDTHTSNSMSIFHRYADYTMQQAPYIWLPNFNYVMAVKSKIRNVAFSPLYVLTPEYWHFKHHACS